MRCGRWRLFIWIVGYRLYRSLCSYLIKNCGDVNYGYASEVLNEGTNIGLVVLSFPWAG
jgi:hypothetical protein